jgi:hypothetical protein
LENPSLSDFYVATLGIWGPFDGWKLKNEQKPSQNEPFDDDKQILGGNFCYIGVKSSGTGRKYEQFSFCLLASLSGPSPQSGHQFGLAWPLTIRCFPLTAIQCFMPHKIQLGTRRRYTL